MKYIDIIKNRFSKKLVFSLRDIYFLFKNKGLTKNYSYQIIHNLIKKKEIIKITKGKYTFIKEPIVYGFAFSPFYYGLQDALSLRNLWEQEVNAIVISKKNIKPGIRNINSSKFILRRISTNYFFGFDFIKYYNYYIPVSDVEKTIIDFVYFNEYLPKENIKYIKKQINKKKLDLYLKKYKNYEVLKKKVYKLLNY